MTYLKSGFVTVIGRPNVGKSTLLNRFVGEKVVIMSDKPQTTRNSVKCIMNGEDYQIVFLDTPGIHKPKTKLGDYMVKSALATLEEVEVIVLLMEAMEKPGPGDQFIFDLVKEVDTPVILALNKSDLVSKDYQKEYKDKYMELAEELGISDVVEISALNGQNTDLLLYSILNYLPEGPKYFPDDMITEQPERVIVAEFIREKILNNTYDEVPHGIAVDIDAFEERDNGLVYIGATIYCDKKSHKQIIIGNQGKMLKKIGTEARKDIETFLGTRVYLELWIKVKEDWRNKKPYLNQFGYEEL